MMTGRPILRQITKRGTESSRGDWTSETGREKACVTRAPLPWSTYPIAKVSDVAGQVLDKLNEIAPDAVNAPAAG